MSIETKLSQTGQALITMLVFITITISIVGAAVSMAVSNLQSSSKFESGTYALNVAESGMEEALIRILRDPSYTGQSLPVGSDTVQISVSSVGNNRTIISRVTSGNFKRAVQVQGSFVNDVFVMDSWREIP